MKRLLPVASLIIPLILTGCSGQPMSRPAPDRSETPAPKAAPTNRTARRAPRAGTAPTVSSATEIRNEVQNACAPKVDPERQEVEIIVAEGSLYVRPQVLSVGPIAVATRGTVLDVVGAEGEWYSIRFTDRRFGERIAYIHCAEVKAETNPPLVTPVAEAQQASEPEVARPFSPPPASPALTERKPKSPSVRMERRSGYIEWRHPGYFVIDGQRVQWTAATKVTAPRGVSIDTVPIGYEATFVGHRTNDGSYLADRMTLKPNGSAMYERDVVRASETLENGWVTAGVKYLNDGSRRREFGRVIDSGPSVERVRQIVSRLLPPYVSASKIRVRVVDSRDWNAFAMANGAIWIHSGLTDELSDDELATVLGHELAHYTHEHTRRNVRNSMWIQLAAAASGLAVDRIKNPGAAQAAELGRVLSLNAWSNGYSRNLEDQADRVGLRYAREAGFDVRQGPRLWERWRLRDGQGDVVSNFFFGSHSRPSDREKNLQAELALNYRIQ